MIFVFIYRSDVRGYKVQSFSYMHINILGGGYKRERNYIYVFIGLQTNEWC